MRIVLCTSVFPDRRAPEVGPFNLALVQALSDGHEVAVVAPRRWFEVLSQGRHRPPEGLPAGVPVTYPVWFHVPGALSDHLHRFMGASIGRHVTRVLARHRPEVAMAYWTDPDGTVTARAATRLGIPTLLIVGGSDVLTRRPGSRRYERTARTLAEVAAVVTVSDDLAQRVQAMGVPSERITTVTQGIDAAVFHPSTRPRPDGSPPTVLWAGRMVGLKRLDVLVEAFALLHRHRPEVVLELVGDGPERRPVAARVAEAGLEGHVRFLGTMAPDQVADRMRAADVVALASDSEGIPNVLREALACGVPFVATDVGAVGDLAVPGWSRLVPPGDAAALAAALEASLVERPQGPPPPVGSWADTARTLVELAERLSPGR